MNETFLLRYFKTVDYFQGGNEIIQINGYQCCFYAKFFYFNNFINRIYFVFVSHFATPLIYKRYGRTGEIELYRNIISLL